MSDTSAIDAAAVQSLLAKDEIYDLLCDYLHAQDRLDPVLHRSVFHEDATTDYGEMKGSADAFVAWAQAALGAMISSHHMMGQARISVEGDVAFGEVYFHGQHRLRQDGGEADLFISGRYIDRYERRDGRWKIAHRSELVDWERLEPATASFLAEAAPGTNWGSRGASDLSARRSALRRL